MNPNDLVDTMQSVLQLRQRLSAALGAVKALMDDADMASYCRDWHGDVQAGAVAVLRPANTEEVAHCVKICGELGLSIVPQGGNTGLVLGGIPDEPANQVVLSLDRMNRIRHIDRDDFSAVVDAGCILEAVKDAVAEQGLFFPLSLGAQGSCHIGGNVSTNAGGINVLRYGMTRDLVLGLEVVLPDGSILNLLRTLRKDNRGIDLKQLFIGAEGTLGIVTAVAIKLFPQPLQAETALLSLHSLDDVIALYRRARYECCDLLSAFEFMPPLAFDLAIEAMPDLVMPIDGGAPAYVLMEVSGSGRVDVRALLEGFLEAVMEEGLVQDGTLASTKAQSIELWNFREGLNEGQAKRGLHLRTDVSVPLSKLANFVRDTSAALTLALPECESLAYGHVGDGNVHLNVLPPAGYGLEQRQQVIAAGKKIINEWIDRYEGSISAEHGIGRLKLADFEERLPETQRRLLEGLRQVINPHNLLNPRCILGDAARRDDSPHSG